jgi:hypothetical protein
VAIRRKRSVACFILLILIKNRPDCLTNQRLPGINGAKIGIISDTCKLFEPQSYRKSHEKAPDKTEKVSAEVKV